MNHRKIAVDQPDILQLPEAARDTRKERASSHRGNDVVRKLPTQLFRDLEGVGLRPFSVVASEIDIRKPPAVLVSDLRAQPVHIVVIALDGDNLRIVDTGTEHLARLEVVWNEHVALQTETGCMPRFRG